VIPGPTDQAKKSLLKKLARKEEDHDPVLAVRAILEQDDQSNIDRKILKGLIGEKAYDQHVKAHVNRGGPTTKLRAKNLEVAHTNSLKFDQFWNTIKQEDPVQKKKSYDDLDWVDKLE